MSKITHIIYGWLAAVALTLGFIVAILFLAALIIGGDFAASAAHIGGQIMAGGVIIAAVAVAGGLVWLYATGRHELTLEKPSSTDHVGPNDGPSRQ